MMSQEEALFLQPVAQKLCARSRPSTPTFFCRHSGVGLLFNVRASRLLVSQYLDITVA